MTIEDLIREQGKKKDGNRVVQPVRIPPEIMAWGKRRARELNIPYATYCRYVLVEDFNKNFKAGGKKK